jgi:hypothetical protein
LTRHQQVARYSASLIPQEEGVSAGQIRMIRDLLLEAAGRYQGFTRAA